MEMEPLSHHDPREDMNKTLCHLSFPTLGGWKLRREEELGERIISLFSLFEEMSQINKPHFLFCKSLMSLIE